MYAIGYVLGWWFIITMLAGAMVFGFSMLKSWWNRPTARLRRSVRRRVNGQREMMQAEHRRVQEWYESLPKPLDTPAEPVVLPSVAPQWASYTDHRVEADAGRSEPIDDETSSETDQS